MNIGELVQELLEELGIADREVRERNEVVKPHMDIITRLDIRKRKLRTTIECLQGLCEHDFEIVRSGTHDRDVSKICKKCSYYIDMY